MRILGIDPGSVVTGYGVIETDGMRMVHLAHGHIRVKGENFAQKLGHIHQEIHAVVNEWQPAEAAIEQVFLSRNAMSALKLGQARGAAITAVVSSDVPVAEYAARAIKQVVTGTGSANKEHVQRMVTSLLDLQRAIQVDAADGLAIAICHAQARFSRSGQLMSRSRRSRGRGLRW